MIIFLPILVVCIAAKLKRDKNYSRLFLPKIANSKKSGIGLEKRLIGVGINSG